MERVDERNQTTNNKKRKKKKLLGAIDFSFKSSVLSKAISKIKSIGFDHKNKNEISENGSIYDDLYLSKVKKSLIEIGVNHPDKVKLLIQEFDYMNEKIAAMLVPVKRALILLAIYFAKEVLLGYLMKISDEIGGGNLSSSVDTSNVNSLMNSISLDQIFGGVSSMLSFLILIVLFIIIVYILVSVLMYAFQSIFYKQQFIRMVLIELYYRYEKIDPYKSFNGYYKADYYDDDLVNNNPYDAFDGRALSHASDDKSIVLDREKRDKGKSIKKLDSKKFIEEKLEK